MEAHPAEPLRCAAVLSGGDDDEGDPMTRTRARAAALAAALAAPLGRAACGTGEPITEPTSAAPSVSATPSASPSAAIEKPDRPAAIDENTQAGAEAAAVYFLELDSYMQATGDTTEWEAMSHETCDFCAARLEQAREITEAGDTFSGGETRASVRKTYSQDPVTGIWPIDVRVDTQTSTITASGGETVFESHASTTEARVEVAQKDGTWVVITGAEVPAL